jgi:CheY-like chemotaxis protein
MLFTQSGAGETTVILLVDDDPGILEGTRAVLELAGFEVRTASGAAAALEMLAADEPELIVSDVMMPDMDGFAFKMAVDSSWPNRLTPFLFLSSLTDPTSVVRGLEAGAWDYLAKPFPPAVFVAKVRGILASRSRFTVSSFRGDLTDLPLGRLLDFALRKELTGELEIDGGAGGHQTVPLVRGKASEADRSSLEKRFPEGAPGSFILRIPPPDWRELVPPGRVSGPTAPKPIGRLSGVRVGERFFSIQSETVNYPRDQVVTIVFLDGQVMRKLVTDAAPDTAGMVRQIEEQHRMVEDELRGKVAALARSREEASQRDAASPPESPAASTETDDDAFKRLLESGFDRYREGDLAGALDAWREANRLKPGNEVMAANLRAFGARLDLPTP